MAMSFPIVGPPGVPFNDRKPVPVPPPPPPPPPPSSASSFPILAITILGIVTTAILLLTYYVFVIKCCLNWHRSDVIGRLPRSRRRHGRHEDASASYSTYLQGRGLEESAIQAIPTFRFRSAGGGEEGGRSPSSFHECAVCLNEFQEEERVRLLPSCLHVFHIDCIDVWLQTHANCPLCRSEITASAIPTGLAAAQSPRPNNSDGGGGSGSVVIEVRDEANVGGGDEVATTPGARRKKERKLRKVPSMGDEFVDGARRKEEQVPVMRRSFSMDSSGDRQLYLAVQEILRQNPHFREIGSDGEGSSSRVRRPFFSFGRSRSRSSQNSLLTLQNPDD